MYFPALSEDGETKLNVFSAENQIRLCDAIFGDASAQVWRMNK